MQDLQKTITELESCIDELKKENNKLTKANKSLAKESKQHEREVRDTKKELSESVKNGTRLTARLTHAQNNLDRLQEALNFNGIACNRSQDLLHTVQKTIQGIF